MNPKTITQTVTFPARPAAVYAALMDGRQHAAFTGAAAHLDPRVGGAVSCCAGCITAVNVELVPGWRIV